MQPPRNTNLGGPTESARPQHVAQAFFCSARRLCVIAMFNHFVFRVWEYGLELQACFLSYMHSLQAFQVQAYNLRAGLGSGGPSLCSGSPLQPPRQQMCMHSSHRLHTTSSAVLVGGAAWTWQYARWATQVARTRNQGLVFWLWPWACRDATAFLHALALADSLGFRKSCVLQLTTCCNERPPSPRAGLPRLHFLLRVAGALVALALSNLLAKHP